MTQIDPTRPSVGRIYDYALGGNHNFEIDRRAAEGIIALFPAYPKMARLNRWFLQLIAEQWAAEGHAHVLDMGSGLPTEGHFHECMPDARILYSDSDLLSVTYGQQILEQVPNARYVHADLGTPDMLLSAMEQYFGDQRRLAIGCIGVAYFLPDEVLAHLSQLLHDWCAPGSVMALSHTGGNELPEVAGIRERFEQANMQIYIRTPEQVRELFTPWQMHSSRDLAAWLGVEHALTEEDRFGTGVNAHMFGALLEY
jgi:O-methyltransferase involved in polyketide biosynthesis